MPVAMVTEFDVEPGDRSTTNYDAVNARLDVAGNPPQGLLCHAAGFHDDVFRSFDVWESQADGERFYAERLMPTIAAVMGEANEANTPPQRQYSYELHDVIRP